MPLGSNVPKNIGTLSARRGPRMNSRISVAIEWNPAPGSVHFEEGFTRVINGYGCLLVSPREFDVRQQLRLTNFSSGQRAQGVVVWKGTARSDGWELGVELVAPDLTFWGIEF